MKSVSLTFPQQFHPCHTINIIEGWGHCDTYIKNIFNKYHICVKHEILRDMFYKKTVIYFKKLELQRFAKINGNYLKMSGFSSRNVRKLGTKWICVWKMLCPKLFLGKQILGFFKTFLIVYWLIWSLHTESWPLAMPRTVLKVFGGGWWFEDDFSVHFWSKASA